MNILIITNVFYPITHIGAFRINAFAKYFQLAGHNVTVIAEGAEDTTAQWEGCEIHYVKDPVIQQYTHSCYTNTTSNHGFFRHLIKALEYRVTLNNSFLWCRKTTTIARNVLLSKNIDIVLTTGGYDLPSHINALMLKRKGFKFYWIADFRDEPHYSEIRWHINKLCLHTWKKRTQQILDQYNLLLSVSKPIVEQLRASSAHGNVLEVCNGYDYPEVYDSSFQQRFTMTYLGRFYPEIHPDNWFRAVKELLEERQLPSDIIIKIIGNHEPIKIPDALKNNVIELPAVPHERAIEISINETDTLVMIYSATANRKGIYSGKLLDYLATNKPIIAMYDPDDVAGELIKETCAGYIVRHDDIPAIKDAIMKSFNLWKNKETLNRNWNKIIEYRRSKQVEILLNYLETHLTDKNHEQSH
ncbi:MAG: glycosyl transferase [Muribaculaceae bacterium]|nr:glycosyl transferase [Muribaculaceae bacterium]